MKSIKNILATFATTAATVLSIWALLLPPQGEIDQSVLFVIAQFLLFAATLLGVDFAFERLKDSMRKP
jgi:hypothetical protein